MSTCLNSVSLSGLLPEQEDWDARDNASEDAAEDATLAQVLAIAVDEAAGAARATHA
jgi:hypothetical protein